MALRHEALPVAHLHGGRLLVAVADPAGGPAIGAIERATGRTVVPAIAPRHRLRALIEATASRGPVQMPELPYEEPAPELAPASVSAPAPVDHHRVADLERELADTRDRLDAAEERASAPTQRIFELEGDLERATSTLAAVRAAVGVS